MQALIPTVDFIPPEIQAIQVRGMAVLYYQLPDLDWLLLFTRADQDHKTRARNSMNRADPEIMNQLLKGELGERSWLWHYVGLRDGVLILTHDNPADQAEAMTLDEARERSEGSFGVQSAAPPLKKDPRTGNLQEVKVETPIVPQEPAKPAKPAEPEKPAVQAPQEPEPEG